MPVLRSQTVSRRRFLAAAAATGAAWAVPTIVPARALGREGGGAANDRIIVGGIGLGNRGTYDLSCFLPEPDVQFVAIADAKAERRAAIKNIVDTKYGNTDCATYVDFRELLDREDIDAVLIATGPNWHASAAMMAALAGKDVYCEKPCTRNIAQSLRLAETFRRTARIFQAGTQRRSLPHFAFAVELARTGKLGKLTAVHAHPSPWDNSVKTSGWLPAEPQPPETEINWDLYLGPAAWRPYNREVASRGGEFEKGGGLVGGGVLEWGSHCVDLCQWAANADHTAPVEYHPRTPDNRSTARYASGAMLVIREDGWLPLGSCPVRFEGENGWVEAGDSGRLEVSSPALLAGKKVAEIGGYPATFHIRNFLDCVKTRAQTVANADVACNSHIACHASNIAIFLNRTLKYDPDKHEFLGDDEANRLRDEALREPWRMGSRLPIGPHRFACRRTCQRSQTGVFFRNYRLSHFTENQHMYRHLAPWAACLAAALAAFVFQPIGLAAELPPLKSQKELIAVLTSPDSTPADKAITCKQLMRIGDAQAVPALAALLTDEQLAAWARIALEAIPDPAADEALREAVPRLQGRLAVGVVTSIGMRRDAKAVDLLSNKLADADAEVAAAAAVALGRIGDGAATGALEQFLKGPSIANASPKVRSAVAEGCILCAEQSNRSGDAATAIRLFEAIRNADVPQQRVLEATRGLILTRKADGIPLLVELLHADDRAQFELGLWVARELPGPEATAALVAELERTAPEQKALLMLALMDRQDRPPLSLLVQAAERGPKNVRITAIRAMRQKGDASCVPVLLAATVEADADVATAAAEALEELPGDNVNADLAKRLAAAQGKARLPLIELSGRRGIATAVPELRKAADDADSSVRAAAYKALGDTIDFATLPWLIERTVRAKTPEERTLVGDALTAASGRMPDRDACAERLAAAMPQAATPAKVELLGSLGAVGGTRALAAIVEASKSADVVLQMAAAQQLGEWMTPDAAPALMQMARSGADDSVKVRALRGYLRVARQLVVPDDERLAMYQAAMAAARRDDERQIAVGVLIRIPSVQTLTEATKRLAEPALRDAAANAAVAIAAKLAADNPKAVAESMQKVLDSGVGDPVKAKAQDLRDKAKAAAQ